MHVCLCDSTHNSFTILPQANSVLKAALNMCNGTYAAEDIGSEGSDLPVDVQYSDNCVDLGPPHATALPCATN